MKYLPEHYINRELSWLEFNQRVLDQAAVDAIPLLERVKFLAISGSNLDEFFKVRVGGLSLANSAGADRTDISGMTISQQLQAITKRVHRMNAVQSKILLSQLLPALAKQGVVRLQPDDLTDEQHQELQQTFTREIASVIAPIAIERGQPFPLMAQARLCVCVRMNYRAEQAIGEHGMNTDEDADRYAVISIGPSLPRLIKLPGEKRFQFMLIEDVIGMFLDQCFPDQQIREWAAFRVTRNADIALAEDAMRDLLKETTEMLEKRKVSEIVRLEIAASASPDMPRFLQSETECGDEQVFRIEGPIDLSALFELASIPGYPELKDEPWPPQPSPDFAGSGSIFETIAKADRILIHPYQAFAPVINLLRTAAQDPHVIAVKQTLYRTSRDSEVIDALIEAAENGKQVTAIVELKARFDEARNIFGALQLEQAGVDVIYGVQGLKTHCKMCIVVRRESRGIQRYVHFGTGNYNESTARLYSDVSFFTNNEQLGTDAVVFFNAITGLSVPQPMMKLAAAPIDLKDSLLKLIQVEIENAKRGGACGINAKLNSLVDPSIIDALYQASQAGVKTRLNIRGICCLRPGLPGISEHIQVTSIVDRFLEHSRIVHFVHGGDDLVFISSADWMGRNLDRRAELLVPVEDGDCKRQLLRSMDACFNDSVRARKLNSEGIYQPVIAVDGERIRAQEQLYQEACDLYSAFTNPKATVFKALRGETA